MPEIYEVDTLAGPALIEADTQAKAVGFARRGIKARRLSGAEVRALPADAVVLDARESAAEAAGEGDEPSDFPRIDDGGEG